MKELKDYITNIPDFPQKGIIFRDVTSLLQTGKVPGDLTEADLRDITAFACTSAGLSTTRPGGISSVPEYEEVLARMGK